MTDYRVNKGESILAAKILMALSASISLTLGVVHLVYTFWGPLLTPRDPALQISIASCNRKIEVPLKVRREWGRNLLYPFARQRCSATEDGSVPDDVGFGYVSWLTISTHASSCCVAYGRMVRQPTSDWRAVSQRGALQQGQR